MHDKHQQVIVSVYLLSTFSAILSASELLCLLQRIDQSILMKRFLILN
jgi:hypothetical protein